MFIYLTGTIDSSSTFDLFTKTEKELRSNGDRVYSLVNINTMDDIKYKKERIKSVLKADKMVLIGESDIETTLAHYLDIPVESYDKNKY
jgi:hypothetical protein